MRVWQYNTTADEEEDDFVIVPDLPGSDSLRFDWYWDWERDHYFQAKGKLIMRPARYKFGTRAYDWDSVLSCVDTGFEYNGFGPQPLVDENGEEAADWRECCDDFASRYADILMGKAPDFSLKAVRVSPEDITLTYVASRSKVPVRHENGIFYQYVTIYPECDLMFFVGEPEAVPCYRIYLMGNGLVEITERLRHTCRVYSYSTLYSDDGERKRRISVTEYADL